ncbi:hypothetical protein [Hydrogenophaga sp. BPS33]|uniref:hypothetical protein n=1 Tax=Hydrogenophaga sp. BPS33 TaxID=2651974 RepID=UPI001F157FFA|nr:hypothetical protein [Hydrogenophaga sp. BPS33]
MPVDVAGDTSMGAVFAALIGLDATPQKVIDMFKLHYADNPTGDAALLPMLSLIKGVRLRDRMQRTEHALAGRRGRGLEDTWRSYYCVATCCATAAPSTTFPLT